MPLAVLYSYLCQGMPRRSAVHDDSTCGLVFPARGVGQGQVTYSGIFRHRVDIDPFGWTLPSKPEEGRPTGCGLVRLSCQCSCGMSTRTAIPCFEFGLRWYGYRTSTRSLCCAVRVCAVSYLGCKSTSMGAALRAPRESVFAAV